MTINELIVDALKDIKLPNHFSIKPDDEQECIVYTYIEQPCTFSDNEEDLTKYIVLINLYCLTNITKNIKLIKDSMNLNGFKRVTVKGPVREKDNVFNTAIQFLICLDK